MPRSSPDLSADARRRELLDAALGVFLRFGFRKTTMEEVARAARLSRQALYLHFSSKELLFQAALRQVLETSLAAATLQLENPQLGPEQKLVRAFDEWVGRFVGALGRDAQDLAEATSALGKNMVEEHEEAFVGAVTKALRSAGIAAAYKRAGLSAPQLSRTLFAAARGLKHEVGSRAEFSAAFLLAVRVLSFPLGKTA
jgi:AcrR family transcriptional regulator